MSAPVELNAGPVAWWWGHASGPRMRAAALVVVAVLLAALAGAAWTVHGLQQALARAAPQAPPAARAVATAKAATSLAPAERARINRVIRQLNAPWPAIFRALETEASPQVALLSVEPNAEGGIVRVLTEGPVLEDLLAHAHRLGHRQPFQAVRLQRIEEKDVLGRPLPRLSFDLVLKR